MIQTLTRSDHGHIERALFRSFPPQKKRVVNVAIFVFKECIFNSGVTGIFCKESIFGKIDSRKSETKKRMKGRRLRPVCSLLSLNNLCSPILTTHPLLDLRIAHDRVVVC
jgi:hypothetical protein